MNIPSPISTFHSDLFNQFKKQIVLKRDDLIDPIISGNKWRKLKYNTEKFHQGGYKALLTFGGAYSNHIAATAEVGRRFNIPTIAVIRGDELTADSNQTLRNAADAGMQLLFTSREEYALREEKYYHEELRRRHGHILIVPEGGANYYGMLGCMDILTEIEQKVDAVFCAAGTGTTVTGLLMSSDDIKVYAVAALKGGDFLKDNIKLRLFEAGFDQEMIAEKMDQLILLTDYHFGGYAKFNEDLINFIKLVEQEEEIMLDQVYTAKALYAMHDLLSKDLIKEQRIAFVHTGGLQGRQAIQALLT